MAKNKIEIIYQDSDILVVNKPAGISVTKDRSGKEQLLDFLEDQLGTQAASELKLIHRLDKPTSGVMILAKTAQAQSQFSSMFEKQLLTKTYLALVTGFVPAKGFGQVNAKIIKDRNNPGQMTLTRKKGKAAKTTWRQLADFTSYSLIEAKMVTNRTHQLRLHLPSMGLPLAIDPTYGKDDPIYLSEFKKKYNLGKHKEEKPLIDRLTLHAYQISFNDPLPGKPAGFVAGLDKNFKTTIKMLTKHNPNGQNAFRDPTDFEKIINAELID